MTKKLKGRYEVLRQDPGKETRKFYIWDTQEDVQICDPDGEPILFDDKEQAEEYIEDELYEYQTTISVELYRVNGKQKVYIGQENSSGSKYTVDSLDKVGQVVQQYVDSIKEEL